MTRNHIGVDLSKDWLDVFDPEQDAAFRVANREEAIRDWIGGLPAGAMIVCEATSGCDEALLGSGRRSVSRCTGPIRCIAFTSRGL